MNKIKYSQVILKELEETENVDVFEALSEIDDAISFELPRLGRKVVKRFKEIGSSTNLSINELKEIRDELVKKLEVSLEKDVDAGFALTYKRITALDMLGVCISKELQTPNTEVYQISRELLENFNPKKDLQLCKGLDAIAGK